CLVTRRTNMDDPTATVERRTRAEERPPGDGDPDPKDPPPPPPPDPPDDDQGDDVKAKATDEDRARIAEITNAVRAANLPAASADPFIKDGTSVLEAQRAIFAQLRQRQAPAPRSVVEVPSGRTIQRLRDGIMEALLHRIDPRHELTDVGKEWRGLTLREIGRACLEAHGMRTRGLAPMELAAWALGLPARAGLDLQLREGPHGLLATSDFPTLLATVARVQLTKGYTTAPRTFPAWTRAGTLPDFRPTNRVSLGL